MDTDDRIQHATGESTQLLLLDIQANFNYSCTLREYAYVDSEEHANELRFEDSDTVWFSTDYAGQTMLSY